MTTSTKTRPASANNRADTKIGSVIRLLARKQGATLDELIKATGWQSHTVRAAMTGLKKKGHSIERAKRGEMSCYSIVRSATS